MRKFHEVIGQAANERKKVKNYMWQQGQISANPAVKAPLRVYDVLTEFVRKHTDGW